jgi:S-DNA-T family DNA segregation ATPase FtsK/SpoIIIE
LVPGKLKWLALLVALVWLVLVGVVRLVLVVVRYPVVTLVPVTAAWCSLRFGLSPLELSLLSLVAALTASSAARRSLGGTSAT